MESENSIILWHLTPEDGWVEGASESNLPQGALVTLKTVIENTEQRGVISIKTFKEYHVVSNDVIESAYSRFGIFPELE